MTNKSDVENQADPRVGTRRTILVRIPEASDADPEAQVLVRKLKRLEGKRLAIVRLEIDERKKLPGAPPVEHLSRLTRSMLRDLDSRITQCKSDIEQREGSVSACGARPSELAENRDEPAPRTSRARVDAFILKLWGAGHKIIRKDIWTVAGYKNATEFERFQRNTRTTKSAAAAFNRVLKMKSEDFIRLLNKKRTAK